MVDRIGKDTSLARASIEAALRRHAEVARAASERAEAASAGAAKPDAAARFDAQRASADAGDASDLVRSLREVDATVKGADALVDDVVTGKVGDFHEAALRLKEADLALKFALEVRNKFVDAYREVMRMNV